MKRLLGKTCVLVFALCAAISAHAGDFKGFYVGANLGGVSGNSDAATSTVFSSTGYFASTSVPAIAAVVAQNLTPTAFNGGGLAGYNFQHLGFVFGVETDIGNMGLNDTRTGTATYPCCAPTAFTVTQTMNTDWLFTLRPRVGFTGGPILIYGTGGLAVTNVNYQAMFTDTFATAHENGGVDQTQKGWSAGAGVEFKKGKHWSVKGEYLRVDFGSVSTTSTNLTAFTPAIKFPTNVFTHSSNLTGHAYRFGINFHL